MDTNPLAERPAPWAQPDAPHRLLRYNDAVLAQGETLARAHERPHAPPFAPLVGPHLRHVIEHYEALLLRPVAEELHYDRRPRDRAVERSPGLARERFAALRQGLRGWSGDELDDVLLVHTLAGLDGQWPLVTTSTVARELVFAASHAVHHYALLRETCTRAGVELAPHFGIAPATLAHARQTH